MLRSPITTTLTSSGTGSGFKALAPSIRLSRDWICTRRNLSARLSPGHTRGSSSRSSALSTRKPPLARSSEPARIFRNDETTSPEADIDRSMVPNRLV